jgi:hypothetical protein
VYCIVNLRLIITISRTLCTGHSSLFRDANLRRELPVNIFYTSKIDLVIGPHRSESVQFANCKGWANLCVISVGGFISRAKEGNLRESNLRGPTVAISMVPKAAGGTTKRALPP